MTTPQQLPLFDRISLILDSAHTQAARSVNTVQVVANWLIGREIVEEQQKGQSRAKYGDRLIPALSRKLTAAYGSGYTISNLAAFREFYTAYSTLLEILHTARKKSTNTGPSAISTILHAARVKSESSASADETVRPTQPDNELREAVVIVAQLGNVDPAVYRAEWTPGRLHFNLSWSLYRALLRVDEPRARAFYEIESVKNNWSGRELERQIASLLYDRLAKSKDKAAFLKLATEGQEIQTPTDVFKDPLVIEFLGLPESPKLVESQVEEALISNLQSFLLELGKGFAFVARQKRITLDGDHFYIDLVFYHTVLKAHVLVELKTGKLAHQDLGQLQLYVNYYDQEMRTPGDNPTLGLILCTDKNEAVVKYTLGPDQQKKIFASRYKLHLPTEAALQTQIQRGLTEFNRT